MAKILVQVQEDANPESWGLINTFSYDPLVDRPKYIRSQFCDTYASCHVRALDALRTWSMYHTFVGKTMRLVHQHLVENSRGYKESVNEVILVTNRGETNAR